MEKAPDKLYIFYRVVDGNIFMSLSNDEQDIRDVATGPYFVYRKMAIRTNPMDEREYGSSQTET